MILVFLGPPGSGKGTQAKLLAEEKNLPHICLGDMLRDEVRKGTEIGKRAKEIMNAGHLVPDESTIELTQKRVGTADCRKGFILDGFPRSAVQAEALDQMQKEMGFELDKVIYFQVTADQAVDRLSGRRSCKECGAVYHIKFNPSKIEGRCDACGGELYQRKDDEESAIRTRFLVYEKQTKPLLDRYRKAGQVLVVNAGGSIDQIYKEMLAIIGNGRN